LKYRAVIEREGELLGPVDWGYDFFQHYSTHGCSEERKRESCDRSVAFLRTIADAPEGTMEARCGDYWKDVIAVGMYDGWPFWQPTPAILVRGVLGPEWQFFYELYGARPKSARSAA